MKRSHFMVIILTMVMIAGFAAIAGASDQLGEAPMSAPKPMAMEGQKTMSMEGQMATPAEGPKAMERMIAESQIRPMEILVKVSGKSPEQVKMLVMHKGMWAAAQQLKAADALIMAMVQKRFEMIDFLVVRNKIALKQALLVKMAILRRIMALLPEKQMGQGMMSGMMSQSGCKCQMMNGAGSGMMGKGMGMGDGAKTGEGMMGGMEMPGNCEDCKGQAQETEATPAPEGDMPKTVKPETEAPATAPVTAPEHQH